MKAKEIREMGADEIRRKIDDSTQEMFNLRFQHATGQLENTARLNKTKKEVARLKTILKEVEQ
ncbi:50S ribosomal protein L29 [Desulfatibacillum aliphaticivorans]|uniref:Large ribosomal subunit protein uL29 n=1 Tax=Desulfatibacillum aliphaticivorans TaxID=218208 RepID=RL29_DESAL|nr:50S ribosomal protein L29 [Desulfatibacillum aliphaticivorans]B8FES7.1 RecName: Full=Large ribosomal subunit protein uL29; AltName: Full=50S ribosomal protein L29 [Desulfatibacillum aliphaticivorans]ACL03604.1 ribosomal protein L29 [Desulfatibacillum aliphaticivorans]